MVKSYELGQIIDILDSKFREHDRKEDETNPMKPAISETIIKEYGSKFHHELCLERKGSQKRYSDHLTIIHNIDDKNIEKIANDNHLPLKVYEH